MPASDRASALLGELREQIKKLDEIAQLLEVSGEPEANSHAWRHFSVGRSSLWMAVRELERAARVLGSEILQASAQTQRGPLNSDVDTEI